VGGEKVGAAGSAGAHGLMGSQPSSVGGALLFPHGIGQARPGDGGTARAEALGLVGSGPRVRTGERSGQPATEMTSPASLDALMQTPGGNNDETVTLTRQELQVFLDQMVTKRVRDSTSLAQFLGDTAGGEGQYDGAGAKGAAAYQCSKSSFGSDPEGAFIDLQAKSRLILARAPGQPTRSPDLMRVTPFRSYATVKRCFALLASMADNCERDDFKAAKGQVAQGLRWLTMHCTVPQDPSLSWRLTYEPDPMMIQHSDRAGSALDLNSSILDAQQLTSVLGPSKDLELLSKRLSGMKGEGKDDYGDKPPKAKAKTRGNKNGNKGDGDT
jgi:hypothetical protein